MNKAMQSVQVALLSASFFLFFATPSFAAISICPRGEFGTLCSKAFDGNAAGNLIGFGITLAFIIAIVLALFYLIWGGIKWILSGGDKGGVEAARATIVAAVIGLVVTFAAYFILNIVLSFFNLSINSIELPKL